MPKPKVQMKSEIKSTNDKVYDLEERTVLYGEEIKENYGLSKLIDDASHDEKLSVKDAKRYYQSFNP